MDDFTRKNWGDGKAKNKEDMMKWSSTKGKKSEDKKLII